MSTLHDNLIVIDGLVVSKWSRAVFEDMRRGGLAAANCTCCVWENFAATMQNIGQWQRWFAEHADLIVLVRRAADIEQAKRDGRTGIILGFQNVSAFEDRLSYLGLFKELGVGVAQIAYNTTNLVGTGCYESVDRGLSDFGHEVIAEMNRVGMLCDLSHVGPVTSRDVILASNQPVAYTHILPAALKAHPRNKSDDELRFIVEHGGFVGVTMFPPFWLGAATPRSRITSPRSITSSTLPARTMSVSVPISLRTTTALFSSGSPTTRAMPAASPPFRRSSTPRAFVRSASFRT